MPVVDTLVTRYVLDSQNYKQNAASVVQSTGQMSSGMQSLGGSILPLLGAAFVATGAAIGGFLAKSSQLAMDFEAQTKALALYETAGWKTADMLKQLKEVAKLPGLGNMEAIQSSVRLMASGFDFTASTRAIMAFGNALAAAGGGKEDLTGVIVQLGQIASVGKLSGEEIRTISERVPQIRAALLDAFGTANTEEIQKMGIKSSDAIMMIVASLEKLPPAASTAKNELSNLGDVAEMAMVKLATATNNESLPAIKELGRFVEFLSESGVMTQLGSDLAGLFNMGGGSGGASPIIRLMAYAIAWGEQMIMAVNSIKQAILGVIEGARSAMSGFLDALPFGIGKAAASGLKNLTVPGFGIGLLSGVTDLGDRVSARAESWMTGFGAYNPKPSAKLKGGSIKDTSTTPPGSTVPPPSPAETELEKQTYLLSSIERNTNPVGNSILGGGSLAAKGISPVELSSIKSGRRKVDQLARLLGEMMSEEAARSGAAFLKQVNPFVGNR